MLARRLLFTLNALLWEFFAIADRYWTLMVFFSSSSLNAGGGAMALPLVSTSSELPVRINSAFSLRKALHAGRNIEHARPICIFDTTNLQPAQHPYGSSHSES